jgi:DNA-3-methyladenine glycosylase I
VIHGSFDPSIPRCWWSGAASDRPDPAMVAYHDEEWGTPCHDDVELFERLALESFQAGLSWSTILHKRDAFRTAFRGFDPALVAAFDDADRARLMADAGIVRNRAKIDATIGNAVAWLATGREFGSVDAYLATMGSRPGRPRRTRCRRTSAGAGSGSLARRSCMRSCRASGWSTTTSRPASATSVRRLPSDRPVVTR